MNSRLQPVEKITDIPEEYQGTPVDLLLQYHNLGRKFDEYTQAQMLVGMCMDHRKQLRMPQNFAYIIRTGGADLKNSGFNISYAIAVGDVRHIALIGHDNCGMSDLMSKKQRFVQGLVDNAGWKKEDAEDHFVSSVSGYEIGDETQFILKERIRLKEEYPLIMIAPLFYDTKDDRLYFIR